MRTRSTIILTSASENSSRAMLFSPRTLGGPAPQSPARPEQERRGFSKGRAVFFVVSI